MLHHICIWPYLLISISWQRSLITSDVIFPVFITACCPRRTMAVGTPHRHKQCLSTLYSLSIQSAGFWHRQTSMPYHEIIIVLIAHLLTFRIIIDEILLIRRGICFRIQAKQQIDKITYTILTSIGIIRMQKRVLVCSICLNVFNYFCIFRHPLGPSLRSTHLLTPTPGYIRNIPHSISTRTILQRATCKSVCELLYFLIPI